MTAPDYDANGTNIVDGTTSSTVLSTDGITLGSAAHVNPVAGDYAGTVTTFTGGINNGKAMVAFNRAFNSIPTCWVAWPGSSSGVAFSYAAALSSLTITTSPLTGGISLNYFCFGN